MLGIKKMLARNWSKIFKFICFNTNYAYNCVKRLKTFSVTFLFIKCNTFVWMIVTEVPSKWSTCIVKKNFEFAHNPNLIHTLKSRNSDKMAYFEYLHFTDDVTIEKSAKYRDCLSETLILSFEERYCSDKLGFTCGFFNGNFYIRSFLLERLSQFSYVEFFLMLKYISTYEIISMKPNVWQKKVISYTKLYNCMA